MAESHDMTISFTLNGEAVTTNVEPRDFLLDVLRDTFHLTGAKRSCDVEVCGVCTILVDGLPVSACTYLAYEVNGRSVETIEGLSQDGNLHPLQQAFIDKGAIQCGYCIPGMIMSAKAMLEENPAPTRDELITYMNGNICRCTGYVKIFDAIEAVIREEKA